MTAPTIRAALERLIQAIDGIELEGVPEVDDAMTAARAALDAAREGEGPSEGDVADLFYRHMGEGPEVGFENAIAEALARWGRPATPPAPLEGEPSQEPVDLPPDYIDEWITNPRDRSLLEVFHKACISEGGSADEVILRGLKAVLHDGLSRPHRLQQENHRFREPERTILCDTLANGTLLPDPDGTRYGIPPAPLEGEVEE